MDHGLSAQLETTLSLDPKSLWYIHGEAYDLSSFIHSHPGTTHAIRGLPSNDPQIPCSRSATHDLPGHTEQTHIAGLFAPFMRPG